MIFSTKPNRREILFGGIYLILSIFVLPIAIPAVHGLLNGPYNVTQLNFIYFGINFAATTVIFRRFLIQSLKDALRIPIQTAWYALLGYLGNQTLSSFLALLILQLYPGFANVNDGNVAQMLGENYRLMLVGTVFLAPVAEELLYRGLIFRSLYDRSPKAAHVVSMLIFSALHIIGYIGSYEPTLLLLCFIQYLPAAYCLNFAYRHGGTILSPILMHIMTNLFAVSMMR